MSARRPWVASTKGSGFVETGVARAEIRSFAVTVDAGRVASWLGGENEEYDRWIGSLDAVTPTPLGSLPGMPGPQTGELLRGLGFTAQDAEEVVATCPDPETEPELWWLLQRSRQQLVNGIGQVGEESGWQHPTFPEHMGEKGRFFYVHVLLASFDDTLAYHRQLGVDEQISWSTLADLGRHVAIHRRIFGRGGLHVPGWFRLHVRGLLYDLGRLQFNRAYDDGAYVLGTHIPESGPMIPEECDASFERAAHFFRTHFPHEPYREASCVSWLMDSQLADHLPEDSNIVRFQRRFRLVPGQWRPADEDIVEFVFRRKWDELVANGGPAQLPTNTSLQRAIVQHLQAGGHWGVGKGICDLPG